MSVVEIEDGVFESTAFMLLGMALFKWRVLTGERSMGFYAAMAGLGFVAAMALRGLTVFWVWTRYGHPSLWIAVYQNAVYEFSRLPLTLFWLGVVVMAWKSWAKGVFAPLRALGRMSLTNYLGQSVITSVLFYGLHLYGRFNWAELWAIAAAIWVSQAILSLIWLRAFVMGPVEWMLRSATYLRWQPLRKAG